MNGIICIHVHTYIIENNTIFFIPPYFDKHGIIPLHSQVETKYGKC